MLPWVVGAKLQHRGFQSYDILALEMGIQVGHPGFERPVSQLTAGPSDAHLITCFRSCFSFRLLLVPLYIVRLPAEPVPYRELHWGLLAVDGLR